ncbi:pyrroline-5-carboxylate reductase [Thermoplasma acidophilum]|uniref:pyrroline-5-carboxylate reductase n=1 Tax=Thermoplasma acidophilum TaxID=2303 RepID=UPI000A6341C6|nr:pyrroline-5-carboxylate reductase [Thermoplasma acidophilum]MCY0851984.1 pyrroline-5-carboxylate reductase [Thermoplasma acidophilum]
METIAVIGAGTIGSAISISLAKAGYHVISTRRRPDLNAGLKAYGITVTSDNVQAVTSADMVILTLKPADLVSEMKKLSQILEGKIVVSMAAAVPIRVIRHILPRSFIVRSMTNIAAEVNAGYTPFCTLEEDEGKISFVSRVLGVFGETERVDEKYMDALTALSGSGPAYILTIIEAMMYGGLKVGLPRSIALKASYQTVMGSAKLLAMSGDHPSAIKEKVITPGGVTIDGIYELENGKIRTSIMKAIESSTLKARKISKDLFPEESDKN